MDLKLISKSKSPKAHLIAALETIQSEYKPHQFAHVLAQVMHESGGLYYDREVWGPTAAQKRYEGRTDLGNTQKGDGSKYRGYGPIQVTGRANTTEFYNWCKKRGLNPPNFVSQPELIATSPWAGWSVVWYWETRKLNQYADTNDIEMITRRVNGGLNGYADRLDYYDRSALVMLGYGPTEIRRFQTEAGIGVDGVSGPKTRAALHAALVKLGGVSSGEVRNAPVVATPVSLDKPWYQSKEVVAPLVTGSGVATIQALSGFPWQNLLIVAVVGLVAYLLWSRRNDQKSVGVQ
jgi:putative chitinase